MTTAIRERHGIGALRESSRALLIKVSGLPGPSEEGHPDDTGCEVSPSCLQCPLPACKYDVPPASRGRPHQQARNQEMARLAAEGVSVTELAQRYGISKRAVWRALQTARG